MKVLVLNSWAGRRSYAVEVIGETPTRYRVKALQNFWLPGKRWVETGAVVLVPKHAVIDGEPSERFSYEGHVTFARSLPQAQCQERKT